MIQPIINKNFRESVESHIFCNILLDQAQIPLILGIFGPSGEGKTFQLEQVCRDMNVTAVIISPGELESENAGHPGFVLRSEYLRCGKLKSYNGHREPSVLIINDIDTVLGNWGDLVQYTVNRQIVYGQLMAFCDHPTEVSGKNTRRIPIILTGNNPSILYRPLMRPGRMRVFQWEPSEEDKVEIISGLFPDIDHIQLRSLVLEFSHQPIAFWSDVKSWIREHRVLEWVYETGRENLIAALHKEAKFQSRPISMTVSELRNAAIKLNSNDTLTRSFLPGRLFRGGFEDVEREGCGGGLLGRVLLVRRLLRRRSSASPGCDASGR